MNLQLNDKVVVITGGAGSLGSAAARSFLEEGAMVAIADLPRARLHWDPESITLVNRC